MGGKRDCSVLIDLYTNTFSDDLSAEDGTVFNFTDGNSINSNHLYKNNNKWVLNDVNLEDYKDDNILLNKLSVALITFFDQEQYLCSFLAACKISYPYLPNTKELEGVFDEIQGHVKTSTNIQGQKQQQDNFEIAVDEESETKSKVES